MSETLIPELTPIEPLDSSMGSNPIDYHVEKINSTTHLGAIDQIAMEIVDTANNEHYMLLVSADATLQTIEPQLRQLANLSEETFIYLIFQSRVLEIDEYLHPYITDMNNTFYMIRKDTNIDKSHNAMEEATSRFLAYETRISELTSEITHMKVEMVGKDNRIEELELTLRQNNIPLPEEKELTEQKQEELLQKQVEEEEKEVVTKAVYLKWTDPGVEGIQALINEISKSDRTYTSLEVLDLSDLHMGDEGCMLLAKVFSQGWSLVNVFHYYFSPTALPCLHSIILYGNDITKKGANALISAFKYLPQVELLGLEVLRRRLSNKEVQIFNQMQLDTLLFTSTTLDLSNHHLVDNFLVQFCAYVDYLITGDSTTIRKLFMNKNHFKSRGVMKLASLIADGKLANLEVLNLEDNEIDEEASHLVACCITPSTVPNLKEFYIGNNPIGDKGVSTLFRYFRKNAINSIVRLSLQKVQMGIDGIRNISNAVLFNNMENLEYFNISGNSIHSKGFIYIIKSIERGGLPKLEELIVNDNHISDDGLKYLLSALTRSSLGIVSKIEMADNSISKAMIQTCQEALSGQNQLRVVFEIPRV